MGLGQGRAGEFAPWFVKGMRVRARIRWGGAKLPLRNDAKAWIPISTDKINDKAGFGKLACRLCVSGKCCSGWCRQVHRAETVKHKAATNYKWKRARACAVATHTNVVPHQTCSKQFVSSCILYPFRIDQSKRFRYFIAGFGPVFRVCN